MPADQVWKAALGHGRDSLRPALQVKRTSALGGEEALIHCQQSRLDQVLERERDDSLAIVRVQFIPSNV